MSGQDAGGRTGDYQTRLPKDAGEIKDYVERHEPISFDKLRADTHWMAPDDIFRCLEALEERGEVEHLDGDLEKYGTTAPVWVSTDDD